MLEVRMANPDYKERPGRVGTVRPSAIMYNAGVGALVDLPNMSVVVKGLDDWDLTHAESVDEPRLLAAVRHFAGDQVQAINSPPHLPEGERDPFGDWTRVGVPVAPFPRWLRCTKKTCRRLGRMDSGEFELDFKPVNTDKTLFRHRNCLSGSGRTNSRAITARFVLVCPDGHLDDFPYDMFIHGPGGTCGSPRYRMDDRGQTLGPDVIVRCEQCDKYRSMFGAFGPAAESVLPACRGRNPQLGSFEAGGCDAPTRAMVLGASNMWFAQNLSSLYIPDPGGDLPTLVRDHWEDLHDAQTERDIEQFLRFAKPAGFDGFDAADVLAAVQERRTPSKAASAQPDLKKPEWDAFTAAGQGLAPGGSSDFRLRPVPAPNLPGLASVILVERLREAKAFVGFTRIGPYDPEDPGNINLGKISNHRPTWVPGTDQRGEGIFLRLDEEAVAEWTERAVGAGTLDALYAANRDRNRLLGRPDDHGWIGDRGVLLHTLSHVIVRQLALDCGYSSASLSERIYYGTPDDPQAGILIYTTAADTEGTLGGLVALGKTPNLTRVLRAALENARRCSGDPLCSEHMPSAETGAINGAGCHLCCFASETTCEFNNRFLDRRVLADVGDAALPFFTL